MKKIKRKLKILLRNKDIIYSVVCLIALVAVLVIGQSSNKNALPYIDIEMLTSVVAAFFLTSLATLISKMFTARFEDVTKLTDDYDSLVNMYKANTEMIKCGNDNLHIIPVGNVIQLRGKPVVIHDDPYKQYVPPKFCEDHYAELLSAHDSSNTFNQITLRTQKIQEIEGQVHISFARTTYFDSLVTNRAIDFKINDVSVRDLYAHGPFLNSLDKSKLSNHMGFNGMVETSDGEFIFIKRHGHVSIGKNTMQCSIAASLKAKYTLDPNGKITKQGISHAIIKEMEDELRLDKIDRYSERANNIFQNFSFENNVLYFYRDLLEGGKPQLMFYAKINVSKEELETVWNQKKLKLMTKKGQGQQDGNRILFIPKNEINNIPLTPNTIVLKNKRYRALPSVVATVALLKRAMSDGLLSSNVQESFTISKKGTYYNNEDSIFVSDRFIAVIDGVTSKTSNPPKSDMSGGRFASQAICKHLAAMPNFFEPKEIICWLNDRLKEEIANSIYATCAETPSASIILYDSNTKRIINYGDCQVLLRDEVYKREKLLDKINSEKRVNILRASLENGSSYQELLQNDIGRDAIKQSLLNNSKYANKDTAYGFPVLGIGDIISSYIDVYPVSSGESVVLASDGYPFLASTLLESEQNLSHIIQEDPLLINLYKSTKGVVMGNVSYDDRSYIRFVV